jgi:Ca-activated chloride channel family protein
MERNEALQALKRMATVLWMAGVCWLVLATINSQVARASGFPEVGAGTLLIHSAAGFDPAAPLSTDVRISVAGIVARVAVTQRFRNPGTTPIEAVYAFPLPDEAAVDRLSMRIGERLIEGEIREREQAERIYTEARNAGQRASLVTQTTPNLFTTAVANIGPGEIVEITIEYLDTARYDDGAFSLRFPMTLTPRYGEGDAPEQKAAIVPAVMDLERFAATDALDEATAPIAERHEAALRVVLAPGLPLVELGSSSHETHTVRDGGRYVLETLVPRVPMDRDFIVTWRPDVGSTPAVAALTETRGDMTYALVMIVPPADAHVQRAGPRELIYVIDTSGSMAGESIVQAKAALEDALGRLTSADRFNVIEFNSTTQSLYAVPMPLTAASYAEALDFVAALDADGGTEMEPAIHMALGQPVTAGYLRHVIFLTDAGVANETSLFTAIEQRLGTARLYTVGIGAAPNSYFMRKAAEFGRGTYTHIGDVNAVASTMETLFDKLEHVALTDVLVDWPDAVELYPPRSPDLYVGEPIVMAASFPVHGERPLTLRAIGRAGAATWSQAVTADTSTLPGIATLWARRKIEHAIDSRVVGVGETVIRKVVIDTALEHGLVSPYTSLVAVDKTPALNRAALERRTLANMAPAGAQWGGFPRTATAAPLYRLVGLLLALLALTALVLRVQQRRFER